MTPYLPASEITTYLDTDSSPEEIMDVVFKHMVRDSPWTTKAMRLYLIDVLYELRCEHTVKELMRVVGSFKRANEVRSFDSGVSPRTYFYST